MFALDHFLIVCIHRVLAECQAGIGKKTDKQTNKKKQNQKTKMFESDRLKYF